MQDNYISTLQAVQFYWEVYVFYYQSDVGLDDIQVRLGTCKSSLPSNPATTSSPQLVVWTTKNRPIGSKTTEKVTSSTTTKGTVPTMQPQVFSSEIGLNYKITSKCSFKMLLIVQFEFETSFDIKYNCVQICLKIPRKIAPFVVLW